MAINEINDLTLTCRGILAWMRPPALGAVAPRSMHFRGLPLRILGSGRFKFHVVDGDVNVSTVDLAHEEHLRSIGDDSRAMPFASISGRLSGDYRVWHCRRTDLKAGRPVPDRWAFGHRLGVRIERQWGLRKIDILVADPESPESPLLAEARRDGIPV